MAADQMQTGGVSFWRRIFAQETEDRINYAARQGYLILPITAPIAGYIITKQRHIIARCNLISEAAEVAAELAFYQEQR